jgi:predicted unusual protein kinase regulating ubiquinone biosynthesis (AarF/ABC1/UbiB family)
MVPASQLAGEGANLVQKNIDKVANGIIQLEQPKKPRLVMYDFGQAATLNRNQGDGILEIIEAIVDTDVERSVEAFQKMGVLVDGANLDEVAMLYHLCNHHWALHYTIRTASHESTKRIFPSREVNRVWPLH